MADKPRKPSYLAQAREAFVAVVNGPGDLDELWTYVRNQIADSYWNGVEHGATGKVKPKEKRV